MLEFGASFRKARESRNVSLDKIAVETRISTRFLLAIENEQFELLPGGIFNRGFIRTYAERLGLDPEESIAAYEKLSRAAEQEPEAQEAVIGRGRTTKVPVYFVAGTGLLILVIVFYVNSGHSRQALVTANPPVAEASAPKPDETPAPEAVANAEPAPAVAAPQPTATPPATPTAKPPAPAAVSNAPVVVEMEVREESWIKLAADGTTLVSSEILRVGTVRRYTANTSMDISIGNAGGVTLRVNGQAVSSLGKSGQVRELNITPKTSAASLAYASR